MFWRNLWGGLGTGHYLLRGGAGANKQTFFMQKFNGGATRKHANVSSYFVSKRPVTMDACFHFPVSFRRSESEDED